LFRLQGFSWVTRLLAGAIAGAGLAVAAGAALADYQAGLDAFNAGDHATAFKEWSVTAEAGDKLAQHGLGFLYETRKGIPKMSEAKANAMAVQWYREAVKQGVVAAQTNLGLMYAEGRGVKQDFAEAEKLWRQAADANHPMAQFNLGLLYLQGLSGVPDEKQAAQYFLQAARQDVHDAQYALATMYLGGRGVAKDRAEAVKWLEKAAAANHERSILALSDLDKLEQQAMAEGAPADATGQDSQPAAQSTDIAATEQPAEMAVATAQPAGSEPGVAASADTKSETPAASIVTAPAADSGATAEPKPEESSSAAVAPTAGGATAVSPAQPGTETAAAAQATSEAPAPAAGSASGAAAAEPQASAGAAATQTAGVGGVNIQLASQKSRADADGSLAKLKADYGSLIAPYQLYVKEVDLGSSKGIWYRVMAGPLPSADEAKALCAKIKAQPPNSDCLVQLK
jgi:hypothetical protein